MTKRTLIGIAIAIVIVIAYLIFHSYQETRLQDTQAITVSVAKVIQKDVEVTVVTTGNVQAYSIVNVKSRVDGNLIAIGFKEGEMVQKDQLLFTIDQRPFKIALDQAEATLARDKALLETAESAFQRSTPLAKKGYISQQDYDKLQDTLQSLIATVKTDNAAIENAKLQLSYTTIYSPINGRTGNVMIKPGNLVKANDTNPLVSIYQVKPIYVEFDLPEEKLSFIRENYLQKEIDVWISPSKTQDKYNIKGKLTFIDNAVDKTSGTILLKATVDNDMLSLWPGQFVQIKIPIENLKNALLVPTHAIQAGPQGSYIFVVGRDQRVKMELVTTGPEIEKHTVISGNIKAGMEVVTAGQMQLTNGLKVKIIREPVG